jgi:hypothetical protein
VSEVDEVARLMNEIAQLKADNEFLNFKLEDHGQEIRRLKDRNIALEAQLRTQNVMMDIADPDGTIANLQAEVQKLALELMQAKDDLRHLEGHLHHEELRSKAELDKITMQIMEIYQDTYKIAQEYSVPELVLVLVRLCQDLDRDITDKYNKDFTNEIKPLWQEPWGKPFAHVKQIVWGEFIRGIRTSFVDIIATAYQLELPPSLVCYQIIIECKSLGAPRAMTLQWLKEDWIDENLKPGLKLSTLANALPWAQKYLNERAKTGASVEEFLKEHPYSTDKPSKRTLDTYLLYYDILQKASDKRSDWVKIAQPDENGNFPE